MRLPRKKAAIVQQALQEWQEEHVLSPEEKQTLAAKIEIIPFDWKRLARYSFWGALVSIIIAVVSVLFDDALIALLKKLFSFPVAMRMVTASLFAAFFYWLSYNRRKKTPEKRYSNEAIAFIGVLFTALAISQLGILLDTGSGHFSLLFLLASLLYVLIGYAFKSPLIWCFALFSLGSWFGAETGYLSGWGAYYLGMTYPLRFVLFGGVLTGIALLLEKWSPFRTLYTTTLVIGLLYLFIALWILSIFGNGNLTGWYAVKQSELFQWSLLFAAGSILAVVYGLIRDNGILRGFGITFLGINLYTRFFEYFWESLHKAIFFAILGLSFWLIGRKAELIWNYGSKKRPPNDLDE